MHIQVSSYLKLFVSGLADSSLVTY